jgi:hypothetical protein
VSLTVWECFIVLSSPCPPIGRMSALLHFLLKPELALTLTFPLLQPVPHSVTFLLVPLPLLLILPPMTVLEDRS